MGKQNELLQKAFEAIDKDGATDSSIVGGDSDPETRRAITDALYPSFGHRSKTQRRGQGGKIRINRLGAQRP